MVPQPRLPVKVMQQLPLTEVHLQMVMQQLLLTEQQMELQLPTEAQHLTEHLQTEVVHLMVLPMELHPLTAAPPVLS